MSTDEKWDVEVSAEQRWLSINLREIWRYRDLMVMFVKRDVVTTYKQTVLGPLWFVLQPVITTIMFLIVWNKLVKVPTDGSPALVFYMAGLVMWQYFATTLTATSGTFVTNANIFGKVYFPRVILPLATVTSNLLKFSVQLVLFLLVFGYYWLTGAPNVQPNSALFFLPLLILIMVVSCLGLGMFITSLSIKYRDVQQLMGFAIQLLMYATPVIYPLSLVPARVKAFMVFNPMCAVIQGVRYGFTGQGEFSVAIVVPALISATVLFLAGFLLYNRMEKSFIDTV